MVYQLVLAYHHVACIYYYHTIRKHTHTHTHTHTTRNRHVRVVSSLRRCAHLASPRAVDGGRREDDYAPALGAPTATRPVRDVVNAFSLKQRRTLDVVVREETRHVDVGC